MHHTKSGSTYIECWLYSTTAPHSVLILRVHNDFDGIIHDANIENRLVY